MSAFSQSSRYSRATNDDIGGGKISRKAVPAPMSAVAMQSSLRDSLQSYLSSTPSLEETDRAAAKQLVVPGHTKSRARAVSASFLPNRPLNGTATNDQWRTTLAPRESDWVRPLTLRGGRTAEGVPLLGIPVPGSVGSGERRSRIYDI
jgi:hypothetical protein